MLPYTANVYFSLIARYNEALWPWQLLVCALALAILALCSRPVRGSDRLIGALLAAAWFWVGAVFHYRFFATLNFAAPLYAALFVAQGGVLASAAIRGRLAFRLGRDPTRCVGAGLAIAALAGYPLLDWAGGYGGDAIRLIGLMPAPTVLFTVGLLLLVSPRPPLHLFVLPLLWSLIAGVTAWALAMPQDYVLLPACVVALWLRTLSRRLV